MIIKTQSLNARVIMAVDVLMEDVGDMAVAMEDVGVGAMVAVAATVEDMAVAAVAVAAMAAAGAVVAVVAAAAVVAMVADAVEVVAVTAARQEFNLNMHFQHWFFAPSFVSTVAYESNAWLENTHDSRLCSHKVHLM